MKTFEEWLEEFKKEIEDGYKDRAMSEALSEHVSEVDKPPHTFLKWEEAPAEAEVNLRMVRVNLSVRSVNPTNVGFSVDLEDWADDPENTFMGMLMHQCGEILAEKEYKAIVEDMNKFMSCTLNAKQKGILSKEDIAEAIKLINEQGDYADSVVLPLNQKTEFLKRGELLDASQFRLRWIQQERRPVYYAGMLGATNVYWARFLKDFALAFFRGNIYFKSTSLKTTFDNMSSPRYLMMEKWCASAPRFDRAIVKIQL
jgi:hypothetical protein